MTDDCGMLLAKADTDRYLSCLFAPPQARPHLFALFAFNSEVVRIAKSVSDPRIGQIRQQWWLDTIDGIYAGQTQDHPVAQALAQAIENGGLPKHALRNLVTAREFDLYDDSMPSLANLEGYLGETSSSLIQMAALILKQGAPEAAGFAGVAYGLARVLGSGRKSFLPRDMVQMSGETETMKQLCRHARKRLAEARALRITISSEVLPAFLPACLTEIYLKRIERGRTPEVTQFRRQIAIWWAARNNRF